MNFVIFVVAKMLRDLLGYFIRWFPIIVCTITCVNVEKLFIIKKYVDVNKRLKKSTSLSDSTVRAYRFMVYV